MNDSEALLQAIMRATNGQRKEGFTQQVANVNYNINEATDTLSFTGTIPIETFTNATDKGLIVAKDWLINQPIQA